MQNHREFKGYTTAIQFDPRTGRFFDVPRPHDFTLRGPPAAPGPKEDQGDTGQFAPRTQIKSNHSPDPPVADAAVEDGIAHKTANAA